VRAVSRLWRMLVAGVMTLLAAVVAEGVRSEG
jgi:hypothetical protein